ncbi:MAG: hypothetical protein LBP63_09610 [Prevotellaceae bacterium]|jgi:hypothetical protein|nr:hypothetical protein [Prevotellaceae bacterium]
MNIKTIFLQVIALFASIGSMSQTKNVDIDNLRFRVEYRSTPEAHLNPVLFIYSTQVKATKSTENRVSLDEINSVIGIAGQRRTDDIESADVNIVLELGDLVIEKSDIADRVEETKDKNGKITSVRHYFRVNVVYSFSGLYKIFQREKLLHSATVYNNTQQTYSSSEYSSRKDASEYWRNNKDVLISQFISTLSKQIAQHASNYASQKYGFPIVRTTDVIKTMDEKKHLENETFKEMCNKLKAEFDKMTPENSVNKDNLIEIIDYFKSLPAKYSDPKRKADIKIRYASYYNLCKIYYYLDEPGNIAEYADLLIQNEYDPKDGENLKKEAYQLKIVLSRTEFHTRHFDPYAYLEE